MLGAPSCATGGPGQRSWQEAPLEPLGNDLWVGGFEVDAARPLAVHGRGVGRPLATWRDELDRKVEAGQTDLASELAEGAAAPRRRRRSTWHEAALALDGDRPARQGVARRAARARRRPRARALRRLVRALPALLGRLRGRREGAARSSPSSASTSSTCRRSTRSATTNRKGRNNTLAARKPGDPGQPVGDRRRGGRPRRDPPGARHARRTSTGSSRRRASSASRSRSTSRSSARPTTRGWTSIPEWFHRRPDGTIKYAENPPKRYQDIYNVNFDSRGLARAVGGAARRRPPLVPPRRAGLPRRQPAHEAAAVLGVADRRGARGVPRRRSSSPRRSRGPAMMTTLAKVGFSQSYTYFTWKNTKRGARASSSTQLARLGGVLPAELLRQHAGHPPRVPAATAAGRRSRRGSCSRRRSRRRYGIYSGYERFENVPVRAGQRGVPRLGEVRGEGAHARRAAAAARPAAERDPAREPALQRLDNITLPRDARTSTDRLREAGRATSRVVASTSTRSRRTRGSRSCRRTSACRRAFAVQDLLTDERYRLADRRATTSASRPASRPRDARVRCSARFGRRRRPVEPSLTARAQAEPDGRPDATDAGERA